MSTMLKLHCSAIWCLDIRLLDILAETCSRSSYIMDLRCALYSMASWTGFQLDRSNNYTSDELVQMIGKT